MPKACVSRGSRHLYSEIKPQTQPLVTQSARSHAFDPLIKATVELIADFHCKEISNSFILQKLTLTCQFLAERFLVGEFQFVSRGKDVFSLFAQDVFDNGVIFIRAEN